MFYVSLINTTWIVWHCGRRRRSSATESSCEYENTEHTGSGTTSRGGLSNWGLGGGLTVPHHTKQYFMKCYTVLAPLADSCGHGYEPTGSIKGGDFVTVLLVLYFQQGLSCMNLVTSSCSSGVWGHERQMQVSLSVRITRWTLGLPYE
jgi:hypothetical protein